ncbi:MAG: thioredoxin family protein [Erythrobacter sp.]
MFRIISIIAVIVGILAAATQLTAKSEAPGWQNYSAKGFSTAQSSGKTIVVDVYATWCPTCRAQAPILDELRAEKASKDVIFVKVNFDDHKAFLRANRIPRQSTVLVFKGRKEVARSIAQTNRSALRKAVLSAL